MDNDCGNLSELSDVEISARMRNCNYEKFKTLVRMHLSFELDLNTDEFDLPCHEIVYEDKGKLKKWNRLSKKQKHASTGTTGCTLGTKGSVSCSSSPIEGLQNQIDAGFLYHLRELKEFLSLEKNITQEGIFRKTGSASRQNELRMQMSYEKPLNLERGGYSAHDCATVFKGYLADLPEPLLTDAHYPAHLQIAPLCIGATASLPVTSSKPPNPERVKREQHLLNSMQLLLLLLPVENRNLLKDIIELLHEVAAHENSNKMSPENLATLFAPHLICPRNIPPEALHFVARKMSSIIAYMVAKGVEIFEMPAKLSTDIRAYFLDRKRKKTMSPEQVLDESISDISTVNTVYTFVDREKTAAAHTTNTTDTELAQLYAHIQSLPESSKKRRLIKQFNKQNGQGTPLQLVVMNRIKNSEPTRSAKSISDSIKKHIFHKGIISRTPKRTNTAASCVETPNFSTVKNHKLRVLFQSPIQSCSGRSTAGTASTYIPTLPPQQYGTVANTPTSMKSHSLQKSISSSSLVSNTTASARNSHNIANHSIDSESSSSSSGEGFHQLQLKSSTSNYSVSAPVSRQASNDSNTYSSLPLSRCGASLSNVSSTAHSTTTSVHCPQIEPSCCVTPLKIISEAAKQLIGVGSEKKTVVWDENHLLDIEEIDESLTPYTPKKQNSFELKSRYKSEPNLCQMLRDKVIDLPTTVHETTPVLKGGRSLTRRLMKGVSMGNLKFSFGTAETTKKLVRSVSSTLRRRSSDDGMSLGSAESAGTATTTNSAAVPLLNDLNNYNLGDETFEHDPNGQLDSGSDTESNLTSRADDDCLSNTLSITSNEVLTTDALYKQLVMQQNSLSRNMDLITSTPSLLLGRRSMSPITKSTQRMPKAMQESIMTPRSRKPVMVLTTTMSSSDKNQSTYQTDLASFREQDEEELPSSSTEQKHILNIHSEDATSLDTFADILRRQQKQSNLSFITRTQCANSTDMTSYCRTQHISQKDGFGIPSDDALSNNFKEYLLSRSVLTASPIDSSFSSQPEDFALTEDIEDLTESQLSSSLLYCLDGNEPDENEKPPEAPFMPSGELSGDADHSTAASSSCANPLPLNPLVLLNKARKRAASNDCEKNSNLNLCANYDANQKPDTTDKENCTDIGSYLLSKKLLISEFTGETSF